MKTTTKYLSLGIMLALLQAPLSFAGGTNSGGNTNATPGDNSTTTSTPADGTGSQRKGTHHPDKMQTPKRSDELNSNRAGSGSGSNSGTGSTSGSGSSSSGSSSGSGAH